ncbi:MAG: DUF5947 family protein [Candidatus Eremiobacteraeota bacterium]|nr:DUF5947 family protein [Candidatus Eremiobacteraeota bacterium]
MQFNSLTRFVNRPPAPKVILGERCELCAAPIGDVHSHLVDLTDRRLMCACRPCYLLFTPQGAAQGRYKAVPDRYLYLADFTITNVQWDELQIPISLAFFFFNSTSQNMAAFYPSPAGATESLLPLGTWEEIVAANPIIASLESDVEALLVFRKKDVAPQSYIVPIDACYELVGLIRKTWKGFDGGEEAWDGIGRFFHGIRAKCSGVSPQRVS